MSIWKHPFTLDELNAFCENTMVSHVGIVFTDIGEDNLTARMPVDHRTKQPLGLLHGGASTVLAETVGSLAANYCVEQDKAFCVGMDINTSHLRMATGGFVTGTAHPLHLGAQVHVWEIRIKDETGKLVSFNRLTCKVLKRRSDDLVSSRLPIKEES